HPLCNMSRSAAPVSDEVSGLLQDHRATPERLEGVDGVAAEGPQLLASARDAEQGHESRLTRARILAGGLAHVLEAAFCIQEVVTNLEGEPKGARKRPQRLALGPRGTA